MASAPRDDNRVPGIVGLNNSDLTSPVVIYADPNTHRLLVDSNASAGSGATMVVVTNGTVQISSGTVLVSSGTVNVKLEDGSGTPITSTGGALDINVKSGSAGNGAASNTGSAVPVQADYGGINILGTLRGQTGANPSGTYYAAHADILSIAGTTVISAKPGVMLVGAADGSGNALTSTGAALDVNLKTSAVIQAVTVAGGTITLGQGTVSVVSAGTINVKTEDGSGNPITSSANALDVNVKTTTSPIQVVVNSGSLSVNSLNNGTTVVSAGTVNINAFANAIVIGSGSMTINNGTVVVRAGTVSAIGDVASGATDSGNPVKIGAVGHTAAPTAVTDGQRVNLIADKVGKLISVGAIRDLKGTQTTSINNSAATVAVVNAGAAGVFNDIYGVIVSNTATAANKVIFSSGSPGVYQFMVEVPATDVRGWTVPVDSAWIQPTAGTIWTANAAVAGSIEIGVMYVKNI